jgi:hypothetical protein
MQACTLLRHAKCTVEQPADASVFAVADFTACRTGAPGTHLLLWLARPTAVPLQSAGCRRRRCHRPCSRPKVCSFFGFWVLVHDGGAVARSRATFNTWGVGAKMPGLVSGSAMSKPGLQRIETRHRLLTQGMLRWPSDEPRIAPLELWGLPMACSGLRTQQLQQRASAPVRGCDGAVANHSRLAHVKAMAGPVISDLCTGFCNTAILQSGMHAAAVPPSWVASKAPPHVPNEVVAAVAERFEPL